jgi:TolB protein
MKYLVICFVALPVLFPACSKTTGSNPPPPPPTPSPSGLICIEYDFNNSANRDIATINADGTQFQKLNINSLVNGYLSANQTPRLSFDKTKIVFTSNRDGEQNDYDIYIMNVDGSNIQKITNNPNRSEEMASLSPNGQKLLYSAPDVNGNYQIYLADANGANEQALTNFIHPTRTVNSTWPNWSKDGSKVIFISNKDTTKMNIYTINVNASNLQNITNSNVVNNWGAALSPNGQKIVYYASVGGNVQIFVINTDGTNKTQLTNFTGSFSIVSGDPVWSPDGNYIAFVSNKDKPTNQDGYDLYIMKANGTNVQRLTNINSWKAFTDWK